MKVLWAAALLSISTLAFETMSYAQTAPDRERKEIIIGSNGSSAPAGEGPCVEVEIGGDKAEPLDCLNRRLKRQVDRVMPSFSSAPIEAQSQDVRVGVFNRAAVQQQYGSNFGVSVVPQRPAPPIFTNSLGGRR